ncbi:hypothetical protein CDD80_498 [Ophiocordyceps camponoti-rufipedis]|uniref:Uncharacterized protein n=1 Tax=Ophiocordyceps camponoti-rufipedis TaxID=2004952 RepID=A0A2C5YK02_9HYPO|nr:hypothetical protein CDD80_498 [Ophiocordyceps camponoti-rufipedis]
MAPTIPLPDDITRTVFDALLAEYPSVLQSVAAAKGKPKPGQKTLSQVDEYRYVDAPNAFGVDGPRREGMGLEDVKMLVEWKLRHGTFRPNLMTLITSNPPPSIPPAIQSALTIYKSTSAKAALPPLTALRGIGPATASLILAVHDPAHAIFFSDEAFRWLCRGGESRAPIRYTAAEYGELCVRAEVLVRRLGVKAVEVERVAFVLMSGQSGKTAVKPAMKPTVKPVVKKRASSPADAGTGLRRSKRLKA